MTIEKTRIERLTAIFDLGYRNAKKDNVGVKFTTHDKAKFVKLFIEMENIQGKDLNTPVSKYLYEKSANGKNYTNYISIANLIRNWALMERKEKEGIEDSNKKDTIKEKTDFSVKCLVSFLKENNPESLREFIAYTIDLDRQQKIDSVFDSL